MFKNEYQGGIAVEVVSASGKNAQDKFKNHIKIKYDREVKGNVYILEGTTSIAKLHFPPTESRHSLGLIQRFLIVQVYVPLSKDYAVELTMADINNSKRRVMLSTSCKDLSLTPLHAKLPLSIIKRDIWLNLCFDLRSLMNDMFSKQTFKALEEFTISGTCKVRRVFTMKTQPPDTSDTPDEFHSEPMESIPNTLQFSSNVNFITQVISVNKVRRYRALKDSRSEGRETSDYWSSSSEDLSSIRKLSARDQTQTRIAFGTKVNVETPRSYRPKNGCNSARTDRSHRNRPSEVYQQASIPRKSYSSRARLSGQVYDLAMEKSTDGLPSKTQSEERNGVKLRPPTERLKPASLISLVDDLDLSSSLEHSGGSDLLSHGDVDKENHLKVFEFVSRPHSLPRESVLNVKEDTEMEMILSAPVPSQRETRERIQEKLNRITPTPRSANMSPKALRNMRNLKSSRKRNPIRPPSSLSPDLSLSHSGNAYDSAKYAEGLDANPELAPLTNSIISLKSSDATLTASVDTLVQTSLCVDASQDALSNKDDSLYLQTNPLNAHTSSLTVSNRSVREVPVKAALPESSKFAVGTWDDSFEANMLESMKRAVEEDMEDPHEDGETSDDVDYQAKFDDSFEASWSTYRNPPLMHPQAYDYEMKENYPENGNTLNNCSLSKSNPREWSQLLSPPLVLPSVRTQQKKESISDAESINNDYDAMGLSDGSSSFSNKSSTTAGDTDEEEMLDLLYDPCLNCYFDPKSGKYYELKN